jgi:hypothetical protein
MTALYLIKRHGAWFRANAQGYTGQISEAGLYPEEEARTYLDVEGLSIHAAVDQIDKVRGDIKRHEEAIQRLTSFIEHATQRAGGQS